MRRQVIASIALLLVLIACALAFAFEAADTGVEQVGLFLGVIAGTLIGWGEVCRRQGGRTPWLTVVGSLLVVFYYLVSGSRESFLQTAIAALALASIGTLYAVWRNSGRAAGVDQS